MTIVIDGTTGISGVDGSSATPAMQGADSNTGISYGTDTVTINTGGVARVTTNASGNVGIGTVSPSAPADVVSDSSAIGVRIRGRSSDSIGVLEFTNNAASAETARIQVDNSGNIAFANGASVTERMRINSSGDVGIGLTTSGSKFSVLRNSPTGFSDAQVEMLSSAGDVVLSFHAAGATAVCVDHVRGAAGIRCVNLTRTAYAPIEASAFTVPSDYRVKENVTLLTGALDRVSQLKPKRFSYIEKSMSYDDGKIVDGFIAHEAALVVPEAVTGEKDAVNEEGKPIMQGIDQAKLIPLLTAAIQELKAEFDAYKAAHP